MRALVTLGRNDSVVGDRVFSPFAHRIQRNRKVPPILRIRGRTFGMTELVDVVGNMVFNSSFKAPVE